MNKQDLEYFKNILLEKRREVLRKEGFWESADTKKIDQSKSPEDSKYTTHMADLGSDTMMLEQNSYFSARNRKFLQQLNAALTRIEKEDYGLCIVCGEQIPKERLEVVPHTRHCVPCKSQKDQEILT
ncbi:MAG: TraR/DksA family transcriptional regulator [bacterium]